MHQSLRIKFNYNRGKTWKRPQKIITGMKMYDKNSMKQYKQILKGFLIMTVFPAIDKFQN